MYLSLHRKNSENWVKIKHSYACKYTAKLLVQLSTRGWALHLCSQHNEVNINLATIFSWFCKTMLTTTICNRKENQPNIQSDWSSYSQNIQESYVFHLFFNVEYYIVGSLDYCWTKFPPEFVSFYLHLTVYYPQVDNEKAGAQCVFTHFAITELIFVKSWFWSHCASVLKSTIFNRNWALAYFYIFQDTWQ